MGFNEEINRTDAQSLIPEDVQKEIVKNISERSSFLSLARRLPNMSRKQHRIPVLSSLPYAYFTDGDTGLRKTTEMAWKDKYINAEEVNAIVPIPRTVLDDVDYDLWGEVRPAIEEAIGIVIDGAVYYSTNKPAAWPVGIVPGASAAGNSASLAAFADLYAALLGEGGACALVEEDGYFNTGHVAALPLRAKLRGCRDADGNPIFVPDPSSRSTYNLDGSPILFPRNGAVDSDSSLLICGDFQQAVYSIRQDVMAEVSTEAVLTDASGKVIKNLFQQGLVALKVTMRLGWEIPNPINRINENDATRYPFGVLTA